MTDYYEVLERIHELLKPKNYVEIGVRMGKSFRLSMPETLSIGIDPAMDFQYTPGPNARLFSLTSDDFFDQYNLYEELNKQHVHLAFIDGMHQFEYVLRDFINLERYCDEHSFVLIHDCIPIDKITSERVRQTVTWTGDVWKILPCLKKYRPDLRIYNLNVPPSGLAVVTGLNPKSNRLGKNLARIYDEYVPLDYSYIEENLEQLNIIDEWDLSSIFQRNDLQRDNKWMNKLCNIFPRLDHK